MTSTARALNQHYVAGMSIYAIAGNWEQMLFLVFIGLLLFGLPRMIHVDNQTLTGYILTILYLTSPLAAILFQLPTVDLRPVPVGMPGELCIGGDGLALGYLNSPELTAEKFVPSPFGRAPGARLYKTGDRTRFVAEGNIEFLGRLDHQVKLRGFRVELEEIEAVLADHPLVREAVVVMHADLSEDKRLVAYLAANGEATNPTTPLLQKSMSCANTCGTNFLSTWSRDFCNVGCAALNAQRQD